jgi:RecA-family ATPase
MSHDPKSRDSLLLSSWLSRPLPERDYLLGHVICTTSRVLLFGDTGVGKTLLAADIAGATAAGQSFLGWQGRRPATVMYLDGEMPAETFKERMQLIAAQYGADLPLYGYCRDALSAGEMPPLNTPEGQRWLMQEIELVEPDIAVFDSIMCLIAGLLKEEDSWEPVKPLIRWLSSKRVAQIWINHTGHDASRSYGTKSKEWEFDTVIKLTREQSGDSVRLEFPKARLRTPATAAEFKSRIIARDADGWTSSDATTDKPARRS